MIFYSEQIKNEDKDESLHRMTYMSHQIFSIRYNEVFSGITEFAIYSCTATITLYAYIIIRFKAHSSMQFIIACVLIMGTLTMKECLTYAVGCHINSEDCMFLGKENTVVSNREYNKQFWKSRRPVSFRVGNQFRIETKTYILRVFGEIIPDNLVNLLLTF